MTAGNSYLESLKGNARMLKPFFLDADSVPLVPYFFLETSL